VEIVETPRDSEKHKGDVVAEVGGWKLRFDSKSTRNPSFDNIHFCTDWFDKLDDECVFNVQTDGITIPVIAISTYNNRDVICITKGILVDNNASDQIPDKGIKNIYIPRRLIDNNPVIKCGRFYICKLETLIKAVRSKV
jgi:hypothetical protein